MIINMANNVFVDANVLLELFFERAKHGLAIKALLDLPGDSTTATSVLALSILMYYVEAGKFDKVLAHKFINGYRILDMNESDYAWALANDEGVFEDALQLACALRHGCTKLITFDKDMEPMYGKHLAIQTILDR